MVSGPKGNRSGKQREEVEMDEKRFEELARKRFEGGLSHEEANELGRMMAQRAGLPYANAENRRPDEEALREEEAFARAEQSERQPREEGRSHPAEEAREIEAQERRQKEGVDPATARETS
jgi:hypothetical protein